MLQHIYDPYYLATNTVWLLKDICRCCSKTLISIVKSRAVVSTSDGDIEPSFQHVVSEILKNRAETLGK